MLATFVRTFLSLCLILLDEDDQLPNLRHYKPGGEQSGDGDHADHGGRGDEGGVLALDNADRPARPLRG